MRSSMIRNTRKTSKRKKMRKIRRWSEEGRGEL